MDRGKLIKLRERYLKTSHAYGRKVEEINKQLSTGCLHESTYKYQRDADNGYGRWWKVDVERCNFCLSEKIYGTWHRREDLE